MLAALAVIVFNTLQYVIKAEVRAGKTSIADKLCTRVRQHRRPKARETPILRRQGFRPLCPPLCTPASHAARYDGQATKRGEGGVGTCGVGAQGREEDLHGLVAHGLDKLQQL